jgi:hypothetical protein
MEVNGVRPNVRRWIILMILIGCPTIFARAIAAQSGGDPAKAQMEEMNRRELQLNSVGATAGRSDPKRAQALMDEVSEDFQRILILHNQIVRDIAAHRPLTYQFISDATGEIRKRSARLQGSLKLPKPESSMDNRGMGPGPKMTEMNDELVLLCKQIESFVRNPIIEKPGTVDLQQLGQARKDLQSVVELSDAIKRRVDKLKP